MREVKGARWSPGCGLVALAGRLALGQRRGMGPLARTRTWGATAEEARCRLPGDELMPDADATATRATSMPARAQDVWPWIAQTGQDRGGFDSHDTVADLAGCRIHSARHLDPQRRLSGPGDELHLHPEVAPIVAEIEPPEYLVLRAPRDQHRSASFGFTRNFAVTPNASGSREPVRERHRYRRRWRAVVVTRIEVVSFVMHRAMLRGIAERARATTPREAS